MLHHILLRNSLRKCIEISLKNLYVDIGTQRVKASVSTHDFEFRVVEMGAREFSRFGRKSGFVRYTSISGHIKLWPQMMNTFLNLKFPQKVFSLGFQPYLPLPRSKHPGKVPSQNTAIFVLHRYLFKHKRALVQAVQTNPSSTTYLQAQMLANKSREFQRDLELRITANSKREIQTVICGNESRLKLGFQIC